MNSFHTNNRSVSEMTSSWEKQFCNLRDRRMASDVVPELKRKSEDVAGDPLLAEYFELIYMDSKNRKKVLYDAKPPYLEDGEAVSAFVGRWQAEVWREFDGAERAKGGGGKDHREGKEEEEQVQAVGCRLKEDRRGGGGAGGGRRTRRVKRKFFLFTFHRSVSTYIQRYSHNHCLDTVSWNWFFARLPPCQ